MHVCICDCVSMYAYMHLCMFKLYTCLHHCTAIMRTNSKSLCVSYVGACARVRRWSVRGDGRQPNAPQQGFLFLSAIVVLHSMYMYKSNWSITSWYYDCSTTNIALVHSTYIYKILSCLFRHCDVSTPLMMCACARACDCKRNHITTTETIAILLHSTYLKASFYVSPLRRGTPLTMYVCARLRDCRRNYIANTANGLARVTNMHTMQHTAFSYDAGHCVRVCACVRVCERESVCACA